MKLIIVSVGKKHTEYVATGVELFTKRINHYSEATWQLIPPVAIQGHVAAQEESRRIARALHDDDYVILLDETGKVLQSPQFARILEQQQVESTKRVVFIIGGAYGVTDAVKERADLVLSLGTLVMPHQLVRLVLAEQIYRAFTIIRGEPYHHA